MAKKQKILPKNMLGVSIVEITAALQGVTYSNFMGG